jgi:hypothetical protein
MKILGFLLACFFFYTCADRPDLSPIPTLEYIGSSKSTMKQSNLNQDTVLLSFKFSDGDGDIGYLEKDNQINKVPDLIVIDKRTNVKYDNFTIPPIPQQGTNNGIQGTMIITLLSTCCQINPCDPDENQSDEKLPLEIYLMDRAKNKSNVVQIENLTLKCF